MKENTDNNEFKNTFLKNKNISVIDLLRKWGLLTGLFLLILVFSLSAENFFTIQNISNIFRHAAIGGIMGLGLTFAMMVGDFDLSFATLAGLINVINILLIIHGWSLFVVFTIAIIVGIVWGLLNSFLIVKVRIHAFIATLATMIIAKGIIFWITRGRTLYGKYPKVLTVIGRKNIIYDVLPIAALIFIVIAAITYVIANHTKMGRYFYAVGDNPTAAQYSGIKVDMYRIIGVTLSSSCAGIAAIVLTSKLCSAPPLAGDGYLMTVITSVFLGTTSFKPGVVNIGGTIVAIMFIAVMENGLIMLNVPYFFKDIIQGAIIIFAIASITGKKKGIGGPPLF